MNITSKMSPEIDDLDNTQKPQTNQPLYDAGDLPASRAIEVDREMIELHLHMLFDPFIEMKDDGIISIQTTPAYKSAPDCKNFPISENGIKDAAIYAAEKNMQQRNVYVGINPRKKGTVAHGKNEDIEFACCIVVDSDENNSFIKAKSAIITPNVTYTTGTIPEERGHNYWFLDSIIPCDLFSIVCKEAINAFGTDKAIHNPCRIMRLWDTISYPNIDKQKSGYVIERGKVIVNTVGKTNLAELRQSWNNSTQKVPLPEIFSSENKTKPNHIISQSSYDLVASYFENVKKPHEWHNNALKSVICLLEHGWFEDEIIEICTQLFTVPPYTHDQTVIELREFLYWARDKVSIASKKKITEALVVNIFFEYVGEENIIYTKTSFYIYGDASPVWQKVSDERIKQIIQYIMGRRNMNSSLVDKCFKSIKTRTHRDDDQHKFNQDQEAIIVKNGRLAIENGAWVLTNHDKFKYDTLYLPIEYDPHATAPKFQEFLNHSFSCDSDGAEKANLALEMIGYTCLRTSKYERFFILIGKAGTGKSTFITTLQALLGNTNYSSITLDNLKSSFYEAYLDGKLANFFSEIPEGAQLPDAKIKSIVSGSNITASEKFKSIFQFEPYCTLVIESNHLPFNRDHSDGIHRRVVILPFNNQVKAQERNPNLKEELKQELPGIMNLALEALKNLIKNGDFSIPESCSIAANEWQLQNDHLRQFFDECCILDKNHSEFSSVLFKTYNQWRESENIRTSYNKNNFAKGLEDRFPVNRKRVPKGTILEGVRITSPLPDYHI